MEPPYTHIDISHEDVYSRSKEFTSKFPVFVSTDTEHASKMVKRAGKL